MMSAVNKKSTFFQKENEFLKADWSRDWEEKSGTFHFNSESHNGTETCANYNDQHMTKPTKN